MIEEKLWLYHNIDEEKVNTLAKDANIPKLLAKVFVNREITDISYIKSFLTPRIEQLHDPYLLKDMKKAVDRIMSAIKKKEKITIYGDYDVDGITSTSILYDFLLKQSANVDFYIPDRDSEGYGLSINAIDKIIANNTSIIITVDCGVTAIEEVDYINKHNIDIIITDHHECKEALPNAHSIINPCRPDCNYPFKYLAGVGVAFKLVDALCKKLQLNELSLEYLDLVAIGTIADVVPLLDENRVVAKFGTDKINHTNNIGIKTLIQNTSLKDKEVSSWDISFIIAPRINAAGRMGDAKRAVNLFCTNNDLEALDLVEQLVTDNKKRQEIESQIYSDALLYIETNVDLEKEKILVIEKENWHHGIIGIVASKISERFYRPCILIAMENGIGKGSARSIESFNLFNAIKNSDTMLIKYGGHEFAAGLSIKQENIAAFRTQINQYANLLMSPQDLVPKIKIDAILDKSDIFLENIKALHALAPFGASNTMPLFLYQNINIYNSRILSEKHLKLKLQDENLFIDSIAFNIVERLPKIELTDAIDIVCSLEINVWNAIENMQLNIKDIKVSASKNSLFNEKVFFKSLENTIDFSLSDNNQLTKNKVKYNIVKSREEFIDKIVTFVTVGEKTAILLNTINDFNELIIMLNNSSKYIKNIYKICYTKIEDSDICNLNLIVNPDINQISFLLFNNVIFYGGWIDKYYFNKLITSVNNKKVYTFKINHDENLYNDIVPSRPDFEAIYKYLRNLSDKKVILKDLFLLSENISKSYNVNINYFKLKKCIEIFESLNLLTKKYDNKKQIIIELNHNSEKVNIEKSSIYTNLMSLKNDIS